MARITYVFGSGINRDIFDWYKLQPPLMTDFFQQVLKHPRMREKTYLKMVEPLFDYIKEFWKSSIEDLANKPFDLEECYTLIEMQIAEAIQKKDIEHIKKLNIIAFKLTLYFAEYLSEFESFIHSSEEFQVLGKIIYEEKPAVLTFNYDTLLESAIESASGVNTNMPASFRENPPGEGEVADEELPYSHFNWNRPLSYGVKFNEVELHRAGLKTKVSGKRFYNNESNKLYRPPLLKLHGSINWFVNTGIPNPQIYSNRPVDESKRGQTVLGKGLWRLSQIRGLMDIFQYILEPLIITPIIQKDLTRHAIIYDVWNQALSELSECKRLVVGGYSFPPTDFHTRKLFLEAFSNNIPDEVIVINPKTQVVQLVKDLCHFKKPVLSCQNLKEFISLYK